MEVNSFRPFASAHIKHYLCFRMLPSDPPQKSISYLSRFAKGMYFPFVIEGESRIARASRSEVVVDEQRVMPSRNLRPMPRPLFLVPEPRFRLRLLQVPHVVRNIKYNLLANRPGKHRPLNSLHRPLTSCTACGATDAAGVNITEPQGSISLSLRENITAPQRNITQTTHVFIPLEYFYSLYSIFSFACV
jgi:hypothetical protein